MPKIWRKKAFKRWKKAQKDPNGMGRLTFRYAETWADMMEFELAKGVSLRDCWRETSFNKEY